MHANCKQIMTLSHPREIASEKNLAMTDIIVKL